MSSGCLLWEEEVVFFDGFFEEAVVELVAGFADAEAASVLVQDFDFLVVERVAAVD